MGMETMEWYNNFCLIGHTDKRSKAWHYMESMQGDEPNHYPGAVPYADVVRRLFGWKPLKTRTANLVPCAAKDADMRIVKRDIENQPVLGKDGNPVTIPVRVVEVDDMRGIVRSDNFLELGHHSWKYQIHDYEEWLLKLQSNILGDSLDIWSAILLRNGAQACVQAALPETVHDDSTGMDFVPYIHAYTSLDGSLATTFAAQTLLIVCDNTMTAANRNADNAGRQYRAKHTRGSLGGDKINEVRQALSILSQSAEESLSFFKELGSIKVPEKKWIEVMDIILPPGDEKTDTARSLTIKDNKRQLLNSTYHDDPMANTWKGTALGVVQAVNTYATHYASIKGGSRVQRNTSKIVSGEFAKVDLQTMKALSEVLDRPELLVAK